MSTPGVVRVGDTVRRPVKPDGGYVHALLDHFERCGFDGAPRFLGLDERGRAILTYIDGFAPPHNGFRLSESAARAGGRLLRTVRDLTASTEFAAGSEVACHPGLSQPNFVFRDMSPVAIIDWDGTKPGRRRDNLGDFLWAFVHPAVYGDGEPAARMLDAALEGYGWVGEGIVEAMRAAVRGFVDRHDTGDWGRNELAYMERNGDFFEQRLGA
jgi:Phosphotransferase enzyme family